MNDVRLGEVDSGFPVRRSAERCCRVNLLVALGQYRHLMLTGNQIELVQESFAQVLPAAAGAAHAFYDRLFALAPETRAMFRGDMDDQGRKLFLTLATVVDALDQLDRVTPVAQALAVRHVGYGVVERHYSVVGIALIETLRDALGKRFDTSTEVAWAVSVACGPPCPFSCSGDARRL